MTISKSMVIYTYIRNMENKDIIIIIIQLTWYNVNDIQKGNKKVNTKMLGKKFVLIMNKS
jgi:hypothetical protein